MARHTQILQTKNVNQFLTYMNTKTNRVFGISPLSASMYSISASADNPFPIIPTNLQSASFSDSLKNAGSSSLDVTEIVGLIDVRLNPQLLAKHIWNSALAAGSSSNAAYELAYPKA